MRVSYRKVGCMGWKGVLKDAAGNAVWTCSHIHRNRDISTHASGPSALACAGSELLRKERDGEIPRRQPVGLYA